MSDPSDLSWWFGTAGGAPPPSQYQDRNQINDIINQGIGGVNSRQTPQAQVQSPYSGMQMQQAQQLQRIASGQQAGAGELAAQRQAQRGVAQLQSMANMNRGPSAGIGALSGARGVMDYSGQAAGQAQQAAMQDQMNAQGMLTNAMQTARGQDQQMQLANLDAQLRAMGMNDQARLGYLQQLTGMDQGQLAASMAAYQAAQQNTGMAGGLLSAGGQILGGYLAGRGR